MKNTMLWSVVLLLFLWLAATAQQPEGQFWRTYWYQRGAEFGNPGFAKQFSVNSPDVTLNPQLSQRLEARENGMMLIPIQEDLRQIYRAELYLEMWGGNPGTANKRVTINGRSTYPIQDVGALARHNTHQYPTIFLQPTDLVNGYNALQFACDRGQSLWGHYTIDNAALRFEIKRDHPDIRKHGLLGFNALVKAEAVAGKSEAIRLKLASSDDSVIAGVDYQGFYYGYDENGDTITYGWHGMTKGKAPTAHIGSSGEYPFSVDWDTTMLPEQQEMAVRATIRFKGHPELTYDTPVIGGLFAAKPKGKKVTVFASRDFPQPFSAQANQRKNCTINMDVDPATIERAQLHLVVRNGGGDGKKDLLLLNSVPLALAETGGEGVRYRQLTLDPKVLKRGLNRIELISDAEQHGLEVLLPGPALVIRSK